MEHWLRCWVSTVVMEISNIMELRTPRIKKWMLWTGGTLLDSLFFFFFFLNLVLPKSAEQCSLLLTLLLLNKLIHHQVVLQICLQGTRRHFYSLSTYMYNFTRNSLLNAFVDVAWASGNPGKIKTRLRMMDMMQWAQGRNKGERALPGEATFASPMKNCSCDQPEDYRSCFKLSSCTACPNKQTWIKSTFCFFFFKHMLVILPLPRKKMCWKCSVSAGYFVQDVPVICL